MSLSPNVTRWRPIVQDALERLERIEPEKFTVLSEVNLDRPTLENVILAIIEKESSGNAQASGDNGCSFGLMQYNWCAARSRTTGEQYLIYPALDDRPNWSLITASIELFNPYKNTALGARYFLKQLTALRDVNAAILAYNAPGSTRRWLNGEIPEPVNAPYLHKILGFLGVSYEYFKDLVKKNSNLILWGVGILLGFLLYQQYTRVHSENG